MRFRDLSGEISWLVLRCLCAVGEGEGQAFQYIQDSTEYDHWWFVSKPVSLSWTVTPKAVDAGMDLSRCQP